MNYADFSEDERKFYLQEAGFDSREEKLFRLRAYMLFRIRIPTTVGATDTTTVVAK